MPDRAMSAPQKDTLAPWAIPMCRTVSPGTSGLARACRVAPSPTRIPARNGLDTALRRPQPRGHRHGTAVAAPCLPTGPERDRALARTGRVRRDGPRRPGHPAMALATAGFHRAPRARPQTPGVAPPVLRGQPQTAALRGQPRTAAGSRRGDPATARTAGPAPRAPQAPAPLTVGCRPAPRVTPQTTAVAPPVAPGPAPSAAACR